MSFRLLLDPSYPPTQSLALAVIGLIWLALRRYRIGAGLLATSAVWLGLCATPVFAGWLQHGLESAYPPRPAASYPKADAIVVLGGGLLPPVGQDAHDDLAKVEATRTGFGLELFRAARAPVMLVSGDSYEATHMADMLAARGVPDVALIIDNRSHNTHENAEHSALLLRKAGRRHILLVTSPLHMPRAAATFRRQGLDVIRAPSIDPAPAARNGSAWIPQRHALYRSQRCLREYLGRWAYWLRGWA